MQEKDSLKHILESLNKINQKQSKPKPIYLKIAPDLTNSQLNDILWVISETKIQGVIATNTTIERKGLHTPKETIEKIGAGGLSGAPLENRSREVIAYLRKNQPFHMTIIGVGGIMSQEDAIKKIEAGADLLQLYTGFIYKGPKLVREIVLGLEKIYN